MVAVVAFDGVVLGDLAIPCEIFSRAGYAVRVCGERPLVTSPHLSLNPPFRLASVARAHRVIVPGLADIDTPVSPGVLRALQRAADRGARIASICTGAFILAAAGLLDGRRATTHWLAADALARLCPAADVDPAVLYVEDGLVSTSAGGAAAFDLCLHLIRRDFGADRAAQVARACVMPLERAGGQAQFIEHRGPQGDDASLAPVLAWVEKNLDADLSLPALARRAALSERTLSRRFRQQMGCTPAKWVNRARVNRAQRILETTSMPIEQVAEAAGFGSATAMRSCFRRLLRTSPQAHRRSFAAG
ncbi:MAG: helix-turn-helix domain-containing protein [Nannocystaceae bacterium]|nr:helix-turn-helix domain-containing protein [Nannocystaceae bacterium]